MLSETNRIKDTFCGKAKKKNTKQSNKKIKKKKKKKRFMQIEAFWPEFKEASRLVDLLNHFHWKAISFRWWVTCLSKTACEHHDIKLTLYWLNLFVSIHHWACESNFTRLVKKQRLKDRSIVFRMNLSCHLQCLWS